MGDLDDAQRGSAYNSRLSRARLANQEKRLSTKHMCSPDSDSGKATSPGSNMLGRSDSGYFDVSAAMESANLSTPPPAAPFDSELARSMPTTPAPAPKPPVGLLPAVLPQVNNSLVTTFLEPGEPGTLPAYWEWSDPVAMMALVRLPNVALGSFSRCEPERSTFRNRARAASSLRIYKSMYARTH